MATLLLNVPVLRIVPLFIFLWAKGHNASAFTVKCDQCMVTNILQDQQYMLGVRSLLVTEKALTGFPQTWNFVNLKNHTTTTTTVYSPFSRTTRVSRFQKRTSGLYDARED